MNRAPTVLQSLLWPDPALCTETDIFMRLSGPVHIVASERSLEFDTGGSARFDTYGALFSLGKWHLHGELPRLALGLRGNGRFRLSLFLTKEKQASECFFAQDVSLNEEHPATIAVEPPGGLAQEGILYFALEALERATLTGADWQTDAPPLRRPSLMLAITTFRREAAVARTAARFAAFLAQSPLAAHLSLTIVDNGQSAKIPRHDRIRLVPNENLGGSGGFARGLLEAQATGATHCLFMDDDASVDMQAIARTWAFLAYAKDPNVAIAGALSHAEDQTLLWENGALFDRLCYPQHIGADLTKPKTLVHLEADGMRPTPINFYGGWWFFAFPVSAVKYMPFPYFVRGDDVSFSLAHDFTIVTLPGVISYQDEDFSTKESPLTVYLDLRSHLSHHLALPDFEIGRRGIAFIVLRFYIRSLLNAHYETLRAVAMAVEDVRRGPDHFARTADLEERRAEIGALTQTERWQPHDTRPAGTTGPSPHNPVTRLLMKLTLNGHLLPGFGRLGRHQIVLAKDRGWRRLVWGAARLTYLSADETRSYTVTHSKAEALSVTLRVLSQGVSLLWHYRRVKRDWQDGYPRYTSRAFWAERLGLDRP